MDGMLSIRGAAALFFAAANMATAQPLMNQPTSLVAFSGAKDTVFAVVGNGIFRSTDAGFNWMPLHMRPPGRVQPFISKLLFEQANPQVVYAASETGDGTFWRSNDGGSTWETANKGLPAEGGTLNNCLFYGAPSPSIYCALGTSLYRTGNGGTEWSLVANFVEPLQDVAALPPVRIFAIDPQNKNRMMFAQENLILYSSDEGRTWTRSRTPLAISNAVVTGMLFDQTNSDFVYVSVAARGAGARGAGLWRTNDFGNNFILSAQSPRFQPASLFYSPGGLLYAPSATAASFHVCTNLQLNPASCVERPIASAAGPVTMSFDRATPGRVDASTARGLYRSLDAGGEWDVIWGNVKVTLANPDRPYEFELAAGQSGTLAFPIRLAETQDWTIPANLSASGGSWLQVSGVTGTNTPVTANITVRASGLAEGVYTASVTVAAPQAVNSPLTIPIKLTVVPPAPDPGFRISPYAGLGIAGTFGDEGQATRAALNNPDSVTALPGGTVVFSDASNHVLRSIDSSGIIRRLAGRYQPGFSGDKGDPLLALMRNPRGVAVDASGKVYFADSDNQRLRAIVAPNIDTVSTLTANARGVAISSAGRIAVALPTLHIVAEVTGENRLTVIAGTFTAGFRGDGGPASNARLSSPNDVWFDAAGNLYIADTDNHRVRMISATDRTIRTVAGSGLAGFQGDFGKAVEVALNRPLGVALDGKGVLYIIDSGNSRIRIVTSDGQLRTVAGDGTPGYAMEDGPALQARLAGPTDIVPLADGTLLITDTANNRIRRLRPPAGGSGPDISQGGVVSAADVRAAIAPGGLFSLYGLNFAGANSTAEEIPWPTSLDAASVTMNGVPVPLHFVSPGQINGQVPFEIAPGNVDVAVTVNGVASPTARATARAAAPGIFLAVNQDGSLNSAAAPARVGQAIIVYMTGQGAVDNAVATGEAAQSDPLSRAVLPFSARIGGRDAQVIFLGLSPGFVGLAQANIVVPQLFSGEHALEITINGVVSNQVRIRVAQ